MVWEDHFRISQLVSLPISRSVICEEGILAYSLYRFAFFVRYSPAESSSASFAFSRMASLSLTTFLPPFMSPHLAMNALMGEVVNVEATHQPTISAATALMPGI